MHRPGAGIGAIVFGTVLFQPARSINPGESLVQRHLDERVGLVVTQADIVARSVFFDQVAFEDQRFHLGCCDNRLKAGDPRHQRFSFDTEAALLEIRAHPVFQINSLADINDLAGLIPHQINPGFVRQQCDLGR